MLTTPKNFGDNPLHLTADCLIDFEDDGYASSGDNLRS
jgi:hypothetical protein